MSEFLEIMKKRRSYYDISAESSISDKEIERIVTQALLHVPSAYNSHIARAVLLLGEHHKKLWDIVETSLRRIVPPEKFANTKKKIDGFAAGYGTVLYYNDSDLIKELQRKFPIYKEDFPHYAEHGIGMLQYSIWCLFREAGMGASLQHYGNLIQQEVAREWEIPAGYQLIAQMPFGVQVSKPKEKQFPPIDDLFKKFV